MKSLIIIALSVLSINAMSCDLTLLAKKEDAKNAKLDGVTFSAKQIAALKTICTVKIGVMSVDEQIADFKASLEKRMAAKIAKAEKATK